MEAPFLAMSYKISSLPNRLWFGLACISGSGTISNRLFASIFLSPTTFFCQLYFRPTIGLSLYWHRGMVAEMLIVPSLSIVPVPFRTMALPLTLLFIRYLMVRTAFSG